MANSSDTVRLDDVFVPLSTLQALPTLNKIVGCVSSHNIFNDSWEPALIVLFKDRLQDGGGPRKGLFSVKDGTYMGEY